MPARQRDDRSEDDAYDGDAPKFRGQPQWLTALGSPEPSVTSTVSPTGEAERATEEERPADEPHKEDRDEPGCNNGQKSTSDKHLNPNLLLCQGLLSSLFRPT